MRKYFDMNKVILVLVSLTLTCAITSVCGAANVTVDCSEKMVLGKPGVLSCNIVSGTPSLNWFRTSDAGPIISCSPGKSCVSNQASLYATDPTYTGNKQQFTILKLSEDDFTVDWICVDSLDPNVALPSQKCKLNESCPVGFYGVDCSKQCSARHCLNSSSPCDSDIGKCVGGCQPGWTDDDCIIPDPDCVTPALLSGFLVALTFVILIVIIHFCWKDHMETLSYIVLGVVAVAVSVALGVGTNFACQAGWSVGALVGLNIGIVLVSIVIVVLIVRFAL